MWSFYIFQTKIIKSISSAVLSTTRSFNNILQWFCEFSCENKQKCKTFVSLLYPKNLIKSKWVDKYDSICHIYLRHLWGACALQLCKYAIYVLFWLNKMLSLFSNAGLYVVKFCYQHSGCLNMLSSTSFIVN